MKLTNETRNSILGYAPSENDEWRSDGLRPLSNQNPASNANPIKVSGNTIKWPNDGAWYEAQNSSTHETVAEGFDGATLAPGVYNIINHRTGERHEGIRVDGGKDAPAWQALAGSHTTAETLTQRLTQSSLFSASSLVKVPRELPELSQPITSRSASSSTVSNANSNTGSDQSSSDSSFFDSLAVATQEPMILAQVGGLENIAWDRIWNEVPVTQSVEAVESVVGDGHIENPTQEQIDNMTPFDVVQQWGSQNGGHLNFGPDSQMAQVFSEGRGAEYFENYVTGGFGTNPPSGTLVNNFDYRGTWGRAATNVFGPLNSEGFNQSEFWVGSWQDGVAVSDGKSTTFTVDNTMSLNSLFFGRQINELTGFEVFGPRQSDLTMSITWNKPHQNPLTAPPSGGSDPQIPTPIISTVNNEDGSSTHYFNRNDGSSATITRNNDNTTTVVKSEADLPSAASSPRTNVSITYAADGTTPISQETTVTSPTGGTYTASTYSQPDNHTSSADEAEANNNNSSSTSSSNSNSTDTSDYDDVADDYDDVDDFSYGW